MAVREAVEGHGHNLQRIERAGQAVAELMGDEVAGDGIAVDAHAIVADNQVESLPGYNFLEAPFLQMNCPQQSGQAQGKSGQKESGAAVGSRIILEEQEIALWAFFLQERQGIAAAAHSNLVPSG